ncbi:MAG: ParB/RepB/Spo0J family partition protein [Lachnospiraceae bacterium]|nr:ParB/RepB/Spo0J family partition protein [Lachnospiraceae bacterium]
MSRSIAGKLKINSFADIVEGEDTVITEVNLSDLYAFKDHPFRVLDDEKMDETVESIKKYGVLMPGIVRPRTEGGYGIIAGHRRKRACELAGKKSMPVIIKNYTDDEAIVTMVDTNIQREDIFPSEKAKAYRMKFDAMKHQGNKEGGRTLDILGESAGESGKTVQRYIYLSYLSDSLLGLVDEKKLPIVSGVNLSFLTDKEQKWVEGRITETGVVISPAQSATLKKYSQSKELTKAMLELLLDEEKPKERRFVMKSDRISEYFSEDTTNEEIEETIYRLLEEWKKKSVKNSR